MNRKPLVALVLVALGGTLFAQPSDRDTLKAFAKGARSYVELHRRMEGPVSPLAASKDMDEVERLMYAVRVRIRSKGVPKEGHLFTPELTQYLRRRIAAVLTRQDLLAIEEDLVEHTPPGMGLVRVYEPLPEDAPFIPVPPVLFKEFPPLSPELRYMILARSLVLWDHHADLVVDIAPGLFDLSTYPGSLPDGRH